MGLRFGAMARGPMRSVCRILKSRKGELLMLKSALVFLKRIGYPPRANLVLGWKKRKGVPPNWKTCVVTRTGQMLTIRLDIYIGMLSSFDRQLATRQIAFGFEELPWRVSTLTNKHVWGVMLRSFQ